MFSTDFIFRQRENIVDNQKCQAGFRPLCNKILLKLKLRWQDFVFFFENWPLCWHFGRFEATNIFEIYWPLAPDRFFSKLYIWYVPPWFQGYPTTPQMNPNHHQYKPFYYQDSNNVINNSEETTIIGQAHLMFSRFLNLWIFFQEIFIVLLGRRLRMRSKMPI